MALSHFYYVLGMLCVIVPMATTLALLALNIIHFLRGRPSLPTRKLLLLCLIATVPAIIGVALIYLSGS
ncbi:hypothetical protein [Carnimonas bestiolae]|uniref:hypothetical protein n=1 Tax=Carnimonas bestiolae TaxID=3402172 RepID=UPI003EDCA3C7